ncbi:sigma-70 family RNA polymerase sigma factor [bacterium]|jgi:RNA polymerase sigma-70 factor, ECF subfamily|nr:sigma-70 family RNA polymerase sigma factor [bacterium]
MVSQPAPLSVETLARDHLDLLYRYAFRLTRSSTDAEDAVHETFLVAAEKIDQLRSPDSARAWLIQILRHQLFKQRRHAVPTELFELDELPMAEPGQGAIEEQIAAERLMELLDAMPTDYREPLLLFYFEDMRYREIAEALHVPLGTVMSRIARGKAYLREKLVPVEQTLPQG